MLESTDPTTENPSTSPKSNNRDKKAYLKSLERSLRTGRPIKDEEDNDNNYKNRSHSIPLNFIRHCINKHIRRKTSNTNENAEL